MTENPYEAPRADDDHAAHSGPMTWGKGILIVAATTVVGGAGGLAIGVALGAFVPNYYRSVFSGGGNPAFDPVAGASDKG